MKRHFWAFMAIVCLLAVQNTQGQQMVPAQKISATPAAGAQMTLAQADGIAFRELSFPEALKERRWKTNFFLSTASRLGAVLARGYPKWFLKIPWLPIILTVIL